MKIVVPVKQVRLLHDDFEILDGTRLDPDFIDHELNEWDSYSLAAAARLADVRDSEIIAVAVGDSSVEPVLRESIAMGAHRAVRIDLPDGSDPDVMQVARLLASFVGQEKADLAMCGIQSADAGAGATYSALAGFLDWPRVAAVVEISAAGDSMSIRRELPGGTVEELTLEGPCVLAMQSGSYEVPYPTMKAKMAAKRAVIETFSPADLLDDASELTRVRGSQTLALNAKQGDGTLISLDGTPEDVAASIRKIVEEALA